MSEKTVHFEPGNSDLSSAAQTELAALALQCEAKPMDLIVEGHTDVRGTDEYCFGLGERRADSVKKHLVSRGVDRGRVQVISKGKTEPLHQQPHPKNERAVIYEGRS